MKNILEYILFLSLSYFCRLIGLNNSRKFSSVIAWFFFHLLPIRKDVVLDNLEHAFPNLSKTEINKIAYGSYKNFALSLVEILYLPSITEDRLKKVVEYNNISVIDKRYEEKNGVILLSAHFGNWEYCAISVGVQLQKKLTVPVKQQRNPYVNDWMNRVRTKWTNDIVPLGVSIRNVYSVLSNKGIVAMVADQRGPEESIKLDFFGRKTSVYTGPAILSLKMNVPIIYGISIRQPDLNYIVNLEEISRDDLPNDNEDKIKVLSERMLRYLEDMIRKYPEQWLWMHKRWKH